MKKTGAILFVAVFLLMALFPFVGMLMFGPAQPAAKEYLALPPELTDQDGVFNLDFLNDAADYLRDRFWLRQEMITADAVVEAAVFGESASEKVILGQDGWLFYAETLDSYQGQNPLSERQLWAAAHTLRMIRDYAMGQGAETWFIPVPNKNSIYGEYMPKSASPAPGSKNYDRLLEELGNEGVAVVDLMEPLLDHKKEVQLYQRLDSHWNNLGAALANDVILDAIRHTANLTGSEKLEQIGIAKRAFVPTDFQAIQDHKADLYTMLYPAGRELDLQYYPLREPCYTYVRPVRSTEDLRINTTCETGTGSLLMFRDSFGNTLHSFLAEDFAEACFSRLMPYDLRMLESTQADVLLIEITERHLEWLAQRAPIMPAPIRDKKLLDARAADEIRLNAAEESGFFRVDGVLPMDPDRTSPVWIEADGVVYEASPVGETERSFTAYLPQSVQTIRICFLSGDVLYASSTQLETM